MTRRQVVALGVSAGIGSLVGVAPFAASAAESPSALSFGLRVPPRDFRDRTSRVLRPGRRFDLVGVRGGALSSRGVEVRARRRGDAWSRWVPLRHGDGHGPDTRRHTPDSDPVWFGAADELQLRCAAPVRSSLRLQFVAVPGGRRAPAPRARLAQASGAPGAPPPIVPREAWGGARLPPREAPAFGRVEVAVIHHTVTANDYPPERAAAIVHGIATYHRDANGWNDIGYNFLVDRHGQVFEGRAGGAHLPVVGAHAQGYNSVSVGIALIGSFDDAAVTEAALDATARLIGWKLPLHGVPVEGSVAVRSGGGPLNRYPAGTDVVLERVCGHRSGDRTACPGDALHARLPELRRRSAALAGPIGPHGRATIASAEAAVLYGADAVFTGMVIGPDGTPAAGERVRVQKRGSSGRWITIGRGTVDSAGAWAVRVPWRRGGDVRAHCQGLVSPPLTVDVLARVDARVRSTRVPAGGRARVSGRVRPSDEVRITIARRDRLGRFRAMAFRRVRARGRRWGAALRMRRPGLYRLTARTANGRSSARPILVRALRRTIRWAGGSR